MDEHANSDARKEEKRESEVPLLGVGTSAIRKEQQVSGTRSSSEDHYLNKYKMIDQHEK